MDDEFIIIVNFNFRVWEMRENDLSDFTVRGIFDVVHIFTLSNVVKFAWKKKKKKSAAYMYTIVYSAI